MRKFRYIGSPQQARNYGSPIPTVGEIYGENEIFGAYTVGTFASSDWESVRNEWQEVIDQEVVDQVNPQHYKKGEVECIDAIKSAVVGKDGFAGACVGKAIKYLWRYEDKGGVVDIDKAIWYLNKLKEHELSKL